VWGFALAARNPAGEPTCVGVTPAVPGPVLTVAQGEPVRVVVHNDLDQPVSFEGPALPAPAATAPAHGTASYPFTASAPGTYLYQSGAGDGRQLAMGLYGALLVRPPGPPSGYDVEATLVLSAVDPAFHADPAGFDMHKYRATYWLVNGKAYPETAVIHAGAAGSRVLLRYVNAGFDNTTMLLLGMHQRVIARDGRPLRNPFDATAETIPAGATEDTIATVPASGTRFALYNRQLHAGMMTFIEVP
jgi:FtsP/CotA-like multicopper oxidase with cupredoxin domain